MQPNSNQIISERIRDKKLFLESKVRLIDNINHRYGSSIITTIGKLEKNREYDWVVGQANISSIDTYLQLQTPDQAFNFLHFMRPDIFKESSSTTIYVSDVCKNQGRKRWH